jgi:hypothetical protein
MTTIAIQTRIATAAVAAILTLTTYTTLAPIASMTTTASPNPTTHLTASPILTSGSWPS